MENKNIKYELAREEQIPEILDLIADVYSTSNYLCQYLELTKHEIKQFALSDLLIAIKDKLTLVAIDLSNNNKIVACILAYYVINHKNSFLFYQKHEGDFNNVIKYYNETHKGLVTIDSTELKQKGKVFNEEEDEFIIRATVQEDKIRCNKENKIDSIEAFKNKDDVLDFIEGTLTFHYVKYLLKAKKNTINQIAFGDYLAIHKDYQRYGIAKEIMKIHHRRLLELNCEIVFGGIISRISHHMMKKVTKKLPVKVILEFKSKDKVTETFELILCLVYKKELEQRAKF